jgi:hypothetical protein
MRRCSCLIICILLTGWADDRVAAQERPWGIGIEVGLTRFWGGSEPIPPNDTPGFRPYRPTSFGVRVDRRLGRARVGLGGLYAASGLANESDDLTLVAKGGLSWVQLTPEVAYRLATLGPVAELSVFAGPVFDIWLPVDDAGRVRLGGHGGLELLVPLGSGLAGTLRAHGGMGGSLFRDTDVPSDFRTKSMPRAGVALGLRLGL